MSDRTLINQARVLGQRAADRHLRLGITGISGAGKTAFLTSLIRLLTQPQQPLPFFHVMQQQRYLGGVCIDNQQIQRARFPFEQNWQQLTQGLWPSSTTGLSQITLQLRYIPAHPLRRKLFSHQQLTLEITDYPGEWLLDLPMLQQDFQSWSQSCWQLFDSPQLAAHCKPFRLAVAAAPPDPEPLQLQQLVSAYADLLSKLKSQQLAILLQPGRLLRPAELAGSPLLLLFPLLPEQFAQPSALRNQMEKRFQAYQHNVIEPFYRNYFAGLDRQIIMADCLRALNHGYHALNQLQQALLLIMQHFSYGRSSWWRRLWQPRIDKVLFVASKADLLTPDQHRNLLLLLQQMLQQPLYQQKYQQCQTEALAVASVISAEVGTVQSRDGEKNCLRGRLSTTGELQTIYPGEVPISMPSEALFQHHQFAFPEFLPWLSDTQPQPASLRMDQALEFLLGDHLQ